MTTYYVSSQIGSDNNAGTSSTAPLASLQAAADIVKPGDTVQVMNGTYTAPSWGYALDIATSGTATAPITFEAAPGQTPVIDSSGGWDAINISASYIVVKGFTVVGDAADYTLQSALAGYGAGNPNLDGNGIQVTPSSTVALPNHITIENNTVYNEPGGGIGAEGADYVQILNNVVHNNANWSVYGNSGISVSTSVNLDTASGPHDIISGNLVYDNAQLVPTNYSSTITDGEGIILDTNPGYTGEILVQNNTVYGNGSSGIESFLTNSATITGNTVYGNDTNNVQAASSAQIFINGSQNNTVTNNNTSNPGTNSDPPAAPTITKGVVNSNAAVTLTGTAPNSATVTVSDGGASPLGTVTASSAGAWSFTTADFAAGVYAFTATDTTTAGTSAKSSPLNVTVPLPAAPTITKGVVNSKDSVTLTGTAPNGAAVTVSDGGASPLGSVTASSTGAWSFTTADFAAGAYAFTATDKTAAGTSGKSSALSVTVPKAHPAAPKFTKGVVNSNGSVTLTGTAPNGATVTVSNGGASPLGSTAASSVGAWSFTTAGLPARAYAFTATDTTTDGTSAASSPFNVTVPLPAAPSIAKGVVNSNDSVTLTGTAPSGATVTVSDGGASAVGTATAGSAGAWSFTTADLAAGPYAFTATDKTAAGTSAKSSALNVTVPGGGSTASTPVMTRVAVSSTQTLTVFSAGGHLYGTELHNLTAASDELNLAVSGVTITRGKGTESLQAGSTVFPFSSSDYASTETIDAKSGDHFVLQPGFGHETIQGFQGSGSNPDTLQLSISSFPYMNTGMSQSADLAALLMHSTGGTSSTTIADSSGDTLTLAGLSGTTIAADAAASPSLFKFV